VQVEKEATIASGRGGIATASRGGEAAWGGHRGGSIREEGNESGGGGTTSGEQAIGGRKNLSSGRPSSVIGAPSLVLAASLGSFGAYLNPSNPTSLG
jgi:hypothetical protein